MADSVTITLSEHDVSITATAATGTLSPGFFVSAAHERALRVVGWWLDESERRAMAGEAMPAELKAMFYEWLNDPRDRQAKEWALDIMMESCLEDQDCPDEHDLEYHHNDITQTIFNIH